MAFIPENFEAPKSPSAYLRLEDGANIRLRILSDPIFFWQYWSIDKKPIRFEYAGEPVKRPEFATDDKVQFCWAMIVYNYTESRVQIWSPSQATFKSALEGYAKDQDIGDPKLFDIKISRKGQQMETEYSITPLLKQENMKPIPVEVTSIAEMINLRALLTNEQPFSEDLILDVSIS